MKKCLAKFFAAFALTLFAAAAQAADYYVATTGSTARPIVIAPSDQRP